MTKTKLAIAFSLLIGATTPCYAILPGGCIVEGASTNQEICQTLPTGTDCAIVKESKFSGSFNMNFETDYAVGTKKVDTAGFGEEKITAIDYVNGVVIGADAEYVWETTYGDVWTGKTSASAESDENGHLKTITDGIFQSNNAMATTSFSTNAHGATRGTHGTISYQPKGSQKLIATINGGGSFSDNGVEARYSALYRIEGQDADVSVDYRVRNNEVTGEYWVRNEGKRVRKILKYEADEPLFIADIDYIYHEMID